MQVTGYEDGSERPTRPKYDILPNGGMTGQSVPEEPNECPVYPCPGEPGPTITSTFVSSVNLGAFSGNPAGDIYAIRVISGDNATVLPSAGHVKLSSDLNAGAGGKYIYLTFTRDPQYSYENDGAHTAQAFNIPITNIEVDAYSQICGVFGGYPGCDISIGSVWRHMYRFNETYNTSQPQGLNDGAGGKYVHGHVTRDTHNGTYSPIKEIGILSGNSSSIQPPDPSWVKDMHDLNEGAGGNYIYICYKR